MAGEPAAGSVAGEGTAGSVSRLRGRAFEIVCAGATVFGITVVTGLLLYVAWDAFRPLSADAGWYLTYAGSLALPSLTLAGYYVTRDRVAWRVATASLSIPVVGLLGAGGLIVVFRELLTAAEWLALAVALTVGGGAVLVHRRVRTDAALERLAVLVLAPALALFGIPSLDLDLTVSTPLTGTDLFVVAFATPQVVPSVRDLILAIPVLPVDWLVVITTVSVPTAYAFGRLVARRRDDGRGVRETVAGTVVVTMAAALVAPWIALPPTVGVFLATTTVVPTAVYLEGVFRRREGLRGLVLPVVVVLGVSIGTVITSVLGFAGPDPWLDWGFLTSATSRTPAEAGIYPAMVGSVLIVVIIALTAFPVGVGAAIYLEEYAPNDGRPGRVVEVIEINIGNLAGVPSVVYGLLGLALFVRGVGLGAGTVIVGGLTVGLLVLPIVIISAQESIRAVPDSLRQGSYAMGATRWQTVRNVVLPQAVPGILTGTILALGRAIGETAPLLMIGVASSVRSTPDGFFAKTGAMPRQIFSWSSEIEPEFRFGVLAAGVVTLLAVLLVMNGTAILLRNRSQGGTR